MKTIKFADGYTVTISEKNITVSMGKKKNEIVIGKMVTKKTGRWTLAGDASQDTAIANQIRKAGQNPKDYLLGFGGYFALVRGTNGVKEAIWQASETEREKRDRSAEKREGFKKKVEEEENALIEEAKKGLPELLAQIPDGAVRVEVIETGWFDGQRMLEYHADGIKLWGNDYVFVGAVHATRPKAMNSFWCEIVGISIFDCLG